MKVLFVNPLDERSGTKVRTRGFCKVLTSLGCEVSYLESNYRGDDSQTISIPQSDTLLGYVIACQRRLFYCFFLSYDLLILYKCLPVNIPCIIAAKMRGKKVLVDWDDIDSAYQPTWFRRAITRWSERWIPRWADLVTTHNHGIKEQAERYGAQKVVIVPQGIDTTLFDPQRYDREEIRRRLALEGKKVICYVCSLDWGGARDLDKIFLAVRKVEQKREDIVFFVIGGGILEMHYRQLSSELNMRSALFTGLLPQESVASYLVASDLAIIYMRDDVGDRMRFSLKLLEYLSLGKVVVGHLVGVTKAVFGDYCVLTTSHIDDFSEKMMEALDTAPELPQARHYIVEHHDWEAVKQSIRGALSEVGAYL